MNMLSLNRSVAACARRVAGPWRRQHRELVVAAFSTNARRSNESTVTTASSTRTRGRRVSGTNLPRSHTDIWNQMYKQFKEFVDEHGHTRIASNYEPNPKLSRWVERQRFLHALKVEGDSTTPLTQEREDKLNELGMVWHVYGHTWDTQYAELIKFIQQHGHTRVTAQHSEKLKYWVEAQRQQYRYLQQGEPSRMTHDRIKLLEEIDFQWDVHEEQWIEAYEELCQFKRVHGHCLVLRTFPTESLGRWVETQRRQYRLLQQQKSSSMKPQRIDLLNKIGFVWSPFEAAWMEKFHELVEFVEVNGIGNTPPERKNPVLRRWLRLQHKYYRMKQEGEKVSLTDDRIARLKRLGFLLG